MRSNLRRIPSLALILILGLPTGAARGAEDVEEPLFAASLRAAGAIKKAKTRAFTLETIARAWARKDLCDHALKALRAGGDEIHAAVALDAAMICAETVGDEGVRKLLIFARGRINKEKDPMDKALLLASLAGAYTLLDLNEEREEAASLAAEILPRNCSQRGAALSRGLLAIRFSSGGMEPWAGRLLDDAVTAALALPGDPVVLDGLWGPDDHPEDDLCKAAATLRQDLGDPPGFFPPVVECPGGHPAPAGLISREKPAALAALAVGFGSLGDRDNAVLAGLLSSFLASQVKGLAEREDAARDAARIFMNEGRIEDAVGFLAAVAEAAPKTSRKLFDELVFSARLRARSASSHYLDQVMRLADLEGAERGDRFKAALARSLVLLGAPERAHDVAIKINTDGLWQGVFLDLLPALAKVDADRAEIAARGLRGSWAVAAKFQEGEQQEENARKVKELALGLKDEGERNRLLDRVARWYLREGETDRAEGISHRMTGKTRDRLLWSITMNRLDRGDVHATLKTLEDIGNPGHRARTLAEVALRLAKSGVTLDAADLELLKKIAP